MQLWWLWLASRSASPAEVGIAAGIERPTGGRVLINGQEASGPKRLVLSEKRNAGVMFEDFALIPISRSSTTWPSD